MGAIQNVNKNVVVYLKLSRERKYHYADSTSPVPWRPSIIPAIQQSTPA